MCVSEQVLVGRHSHRQQLEKRLDYLRFHLNGSAVRMEEADVLALAATMCGGGGVDPVLERELFFDWLKLAKFHKTRVKQRVAVCRP